MTFIPPRRPSTKKKEETHKEIKKYCVEYISNCSSGTCVISSYDFEGAFIEVKNKFKGVEIISISLMQKR